MTCAILKKHKKKIIFLTAATAIIFTVSTASVTYALYNTKTQTLDNGFKAMHVNIGIVEQSVCENEKIVYENNLIGNSSFNNIESGKYCAKSVAIKNIDSDDYPTADTNVRVRLVPSFKYNSDSEYAGQTVPMDIRNLVEYEYGYPAEDGSFWEIKKVDGEDYFYYSRPLKPGEISSELIRSVKYSGEIPKNSHFELAVLTEGTVAE